MVQLPPSGRRGRAELQPVQPKPSVCKNLFAWYWYGTSMIKAVPRAVVAQKSQIAAAIFASLATRYMYVEAEG